MNTGEKHDKKRKNFMLITKDYFHFLNKDYGFMEPLYNEYAQNNGSVTRDEFIYRHQKNKKVIKIYNSYHPIDYGFAIEIYTIKNSDEKENEEMIYYKLKEKQDTEQSFLEEARRILKEKIENRK